MHALSIQILLWLVSETNYNERTKVKHMNELKICGANVFSVGACKYLMVQAFPSIHRQVDHKPNAQLMSIIK